MAVIAGAPAGDTAYEAWPAGRLPACLGTKFSPWAAYSVVSAPGGGPPDGYITPSGRPERVRAFACLNAEGRCTRHVRTVAEALACIAGDLPGATEGAAALLLYPDGPAAWDPHWRPPSCAAGTRRVLGSYLATPVTLGPHARPALGAGTPGTHAVNVMATPLARSYGFTQRAARGPVAVIGLLPTGENADGHLANLLARLQGGYHAAEPHGAAR